MSEKYSVRLENETLIFNAAHFITYDQNTCESLHGHSFRVCAEVQGPLDENHYVIDFIALREILKKIVSELDHGVLLPTLHQTIRVVEHDQEIEVTFEDRRWIFPTDGCHLLPIENTTAESLAFYIGTQLLDNVQLQLGIRPQSIRVAVEEEPSQWGVWETCFDTDAE